MADNRNYGIDLLRIISMFMVCVLHVLGAGGVLSATEPFRTQYNVSWFLEALSFCAVNCYAIISGYVGVYAKHKYSGIVNLWLQVFFYSLLITVLFYNWQPGLVSEEVQLKAVFPVSMGQYWYFTAYFLLYFFAPILNAGISVLPKEKLRGLLAVLFVSLTVLPLLFKKDIFSTMQGYSALWLLYLYCIGAYIKVHGIETKVKTGWCLLAFVLCTLLSWAAKLGIDYKLMQIPYNPDWEYLILTYPAPFVAGAAIALFLIFAKLNVRFGKGLIRFFAPLSFSVFLIHTHPLIFGNYLWNSCAFLAQLSPAKMVGGACLIALAIHIGCSIIDLPRHYLFKYGVNKATAWIENKLTKK